MSHTSHHPVIDLFLFLNSTPGEHIEHIVMVFSYIYRHPSNLMLDRLSGKILHIDFGDCFEVKCFPSFTTRQCKLWFCLQMTFGFV